VIIPWLFPPCHSWRTRPSSVCSDGNSRGWQGHAVLSWKPVLWQGGGLGHWGTRVILPGPVVTPSGQAPLDQRGKLGPSNAWTGERAMRGSSGRDSHKAGGCIAGSAAAPLPGERTVRVGGRGGWLGGSTSCISSGRQHWVGRTVLGEDRRWKSLHPGREETPKQDLLFASC